MGHRTEAPATGCGGGSQGNRRRPPPDEGARKGPEGRLRRALRAGLGRVRRVAATFREGALGVAQLLARVVLAGVLVAGVALVVREAEEQVRAADAFAVHELVVDGLDRLDEATVLEVAGLEAGQNVLARTPEEVEVALASHPRIAEASVERRLPGTWRLTIREHVPAAILSLGAPCPTEARDSGGASGDASGDDGEGKSGTRPDHPGERALVCDGALVLVSDRGVPFDALGPDEDLDLPVVTGMPLVRFRREPGWREERLTAVAALLRDYAASGMGSAAPLQEVHVEDGGGLSVVAGDDGLLLRLGRGPYGPILRRARRVLRAFERRHRSPAYVLLDDPRHPERVTVGMLD